MLPRRKFLGAGAALSALAALGPGLRLAHAGRAAVPRPGPRAAAGEPRFRLAYAPHLGMFRHLGGEDPLDQIRFMADQGFTAFEDNELAGRPVALQAAIGEELQRLDMRMGVFVAHGNAWGKPSFASGDAAERERFLADLLASIEVAKRVHATWMTVVPGELDPRLELEYQTAHVIETLRRGAELLAPEGLVMVIEPLNPWRDHPRMFLSSVPQAYLICRAVDSPACKILYDVYHQQIAGGNLIPNLDKAWDEIAYLQVGDNPGRNEPGTGEVEYAAVFRHLAKRGWTGVIGMEHGNSAGGADGERAVIAAYRARDPA
jgi:hydroxypyruvate isomerase